MVWGMYETVTNIYNGYSIYVDSNDCSIIKILNLYMTRVNHPHSHFSYSYSLLKQLLRVNDGNVDDGYQHQ